MRTIDRVEQAPSRERIGATSRPRAVLVSLWTADDVATARLMPACYHGMAEGMSRAAALRAAQRAVRECHPHPYHWAPFALVGAR